MYQGISVAHDHNCLPSAGSNPSTLPKIARAISVLSLPAATRMGVFHDCLIPLARHFSLPVLRSSATSDSLSTLALMITRSPNSTGDAADPQPLSLLPT